MGLGGFEPPTSPLSGVRSNQLSYRPVVTSLLLYRSRWEPEPLSRRRPALAGRLESVHEKRPGDNRRNRVRDTAIDQAIRVDAASRCPACFKEVIQPQVPLRLPCYDFTPVMDHTVVTVLPKVRLATSGATHSHGVTGGVYKARERIHRDILIRDY